MLKRRVGPGVTITYRGLGDKYHVVSESSACPEAGMVHALKERNLVLVNWEDGISSAP